MQEKSKFARRCSDAKIAKIFELYDEGYCEREIARRLNVQPNTVHNHVFDRMPPAKISAGEKRRISKLLSLSEKQVIRLRQQGCLHGVPATELARKFGVAQTTALSCLKGRTYRWVGGPTIPRFKLRRPINEQEIVWLEPGEPVVKHRKGQKRGPKFGSVKLVRMGELKKAADKIGMKPCTISKWVHDGKLKVVDGRIDLRTLPKNGRK